MTVPISACPCKGCAYRGQTVFREPCMTCSVDSWDCFKPVGITVSQVKLFTFEKMNQKLCPRCGRVLVEEGSMKRDLAGVWYWDGHKVYCCPVCTPQEKVNQ